MFSIRLHGIVLRYLMMYQNARTIGFKYLLNPDTGELHRVTSDLINSNHLHTANLTKYIGLANLGLIKFHILPVGTTVPIHELLLTNLLGTNTISKYKHCIWD